MPDDQGGHHQRGVAGRRHHQGASRGGIELRGFGVFQVKPRKRGIGRNPRTGMEVRIPPGSTIRFKPGKDLQNLVRAVVEETPAPPVG